MAPFANSTELYVRNGTFANLAARAPGYTLDCAKLPGRPQDHPDWDPRHEKEASCVLESTDIYRHYEVKIPNDRIFDGTRIRDRGDNACGSSVFDTLHGIQCMSGFFSCELHEVSCSFVTPHCQAPSTSNKSDNPCACAGRSRPP